jgi:hypothetical protein
LNPFRFHLILTNIPGVYQHKGNSLEWKHSRRAARCKGKGKGKARRRIESCIFRRRFSFLDGRIGILVRAWTRMRGNWPIMRFIPKLSGVCAWQKIWSPFAFFDDVDV